MHLNTLGNGRLLSRGGGGAPLMDQFGNIVAGRSPHKSNMFLRSNIGTPLVINSGNGINTINAQNPFIIPGVDQNPTNVVLTNAPRFGDGQPISGETLLMPGGQPFIPSPEIFLNGSQSLPSLHIPGWGSAIGTEKSPVRQSITEYIKTDSGVVPGTSNEITHENYLKYRQVREENDRLSQLEFNHYKKLHPDMNPEDISRARYLYGKDYPPKSPYRGSNWYRDDPYWWDDYYWGNRLGSRYGSRHGSRYGSRYGSRHGSRHGSRYGSRHSRRGKWFGNRYDNYYYDGYYDDYSDPYYKGYDYDDYYRHDRLGTYKGKRDPNARHGEYGHWHNDAEAKFRPPRWSKQQDWDPYLWRRNKPPPFWMYGDDKKTHWEFKKQWERWYKGDSKDWWDKYVPDDFKGKVENLVNDKIQKVANDLTEKERALYDRIKVLKNTGQNDDVKKQRYLEEIYRLKNKIKDQELQEDLRHNYVYQIMFENWKKKHKALAPYDGKEMKLPDI